MFFMETIINIAFFFPYVLGIFISYEFMKSPDLSVDGVFTLAAIIFALSVSNGIPYILSIILAIASGTFVSLLVSLTQYKAKMNSLIAGILILFVLQSLNLIILGKPNFNLLTYNNYFNVFKHEISTPIQAIICFAFILLLMSSVIFLAGSKLGILLRAYGSNARALKYYGISQDNVRMLGFMISGLCVSLAGIISSQLLGFVDIQMANGQIIIGIGTVLVGGHIYESYFEKFQNKNFFKVLACLLGVVIYFVLVDILLFLSIDLIYLKFFIGLIIVLFLSFSGKKSYFQEGN